MIMKLAKSVEKIEGEEELFKIIASEATMDRDREIMLPSSWDLSIYKTHPIILDRHLNENMRTIGQAVDVENTGEQLLLKIKYWNGEGNPYADWCYFIARKKMAAFSVGYTPKEWSEDVYSKEFREAKSKGLYKDERPIRIYTKVVLDEVSQVAVPCLQTALQKNKDLSVDEVLRAGGAAFPEEADYIKWVKEGKKSFIIPLIERMDKLAEEQSRLYKEKFSVKESQEAEETEKEKNDEDEEECRNENDVEQITDENAVYEKIYSMVKG